MSLSLVSTALFTPTTQLKLNENGENQMKNVRAFYLGLSCPSIFKEKTSLRPLF
jgi:hypothetical protein